MSGVQTRSVKDKDEGLRLDRWFKTYFPGLPFGQLQKIVRKGQVRVDGKRAKTNQRLEVGQEIRIPPLDDNATVDPVKLGKSRGPKPLSDADVKFVQSLVIFKNKDVIAINKPAGLAVQGGTKTERHLDGMLEALQYDAEEKPRLVHRLDRDTSGVLLLARNRASATTMGRAFKHRTTRKIYWAIVVGIPDPEEGRLTHPLGKLGGKGGERVVVDEENGKNAVTEFMTMERAGRRLALVALWPKTGRTHQLRAHMAAIGTPILGDGKYGGREAFVDSEDIAKQMHLHARELQLPDEKNGKMGPAIKAALPDYFLKTLKGIGFEYEDWLNQDPFEDLE
ncbi:RluA family pseudouridine synthase [Curvivirga sp.]|uniref:RluA family pseudouridine synthase n=1 Tax=Curvivirga sp. TaxID=2856848 RepID=UPI003B5B30F3